MSCYAMILQNKTEGKIILFHHRDTEKDKQRISYTKNSSFRGNTKSRRGERLFRQSQDFPIFYFKHFSRLFEVDSTNLRISTLWQKFYRPISCIASNHSP